MARCEKRKRNRINSGHGKGLVTLRASSRLGLVMVCLLSLCSGGCRDQLAGGASRKRNLSPPMLFRLHCSQCHGDGSGNGHRVPNLKGKPKDLTTADWQAKVTDEHLFRVISEGGPAVQLHSDMPAWNRQLSKRQIKDLVDYIRTLDDKKPTGLQELDLGSP